MTGSQNRLHHRFVRFGRTLHQGGEIAVPGFRNFVCWILALCCAALLSAAPLRAQENLDQGKSPAQLFNGDCVVCHQSPNGLSKTTDTRAVADFLRQHYTASRETASSLAAFLTQQADRTGKQRPAIGRPTERATPDERATPPAPVVRRGGLFGLGDDTAKPDARDEPPAAVGPASRQRRPPRPIEGVKPSEAGDEKKDDAAKPEQAKPDARPRRASRSETAARPPKPIEGAKPAEGSDEKKAEQPEIARPERPEPKPETKPRRQARPDDAAKPAATESRKRTSAAPKDAAKETPKETPKPASAHVSTEPKETPAAAPAPAAASPPAAAPAPATPARKDDIAD
ncbi:MAG: hypothetical protein JWN71_1556 [Xanthobacteraceae bacterium]|nr:hypothetical protein [Xanthobacteraceae bacterium]